MVPVGAHTFRHTKAYECVLKGMTWTEIGHLLADTADIVEKNYGHFNDAVAKAVAAKARATWPEHDPELQVKPEPDHGALVEQLRRLDEQRKTLEKQLKDFQPGAFSGAAPFARA
jgi:hypothetical protein